MTRLITLDNYKTLIKVARVYQKYVKTRKNKYTKILKRDAFYDEETNRLIAYKIKEGIPFMVARYGSTEARTIHRFLIQKKNYSDWVGIYKFLHGDIKEFWNFWNLFPRPIDEFCNGPGFFPNDKNLFEKFSTVYENAAKQLDLLAVWHGYEEFMPGVPEEITLCQLKDIEPWFSKNPWTKALEGKKVLVVHPFEETIRKQYENHRTEIFKNQEVLPIFNLQIIKAVQSIADEKDLAYKDWFEALEHMKKQIQETDFDVAIIGCGAYGFPLSAYVKQMGKQAIHLGGVTQLLFGIKGKGWEGIKEYEALKTGAWTSPLEIPRGYKKVEGGRYW